MEPLYDNATQLREQQHHVPYPSAASTEKPIEYQYVDPQATDVGIESDWDDNSSIIPDQKMKAKPEKVVLVNRNLSPPPLLENTMQPSDETESELDWTSVRGKHPKPNIVHVPHKQDVVEVEVEIENSPRKKSPAKKRFKPKSTSPARKHPKKAAKYKEKVDPIGDVFDVLDAPDDEANLEQLRLHFKRGNQTVPKGDGQRMNTINMKDSPLRPTNSPKKPKVVAGTPNKTTDIITNARPADESDTLMSDKVESVEECIKIFFREFFTVLSVVTSLFVVCFTEAVRFVMFHIVARLLLRSFLYFTDVLFKPLLQAVFHGLISPVLQLMQSTCSALSLAMNPLAGMCLAFMQPLIQLVAACRLVVVETRHCPLASQV